MPKYISTSWRLLLENNISPFFKDIDIQPIIPVLNNKADGYIGWGNKKTGLASEKLAKKYNKPFFKLEDGFLRSLGPRHISKQSLSLIIDDIGIYYDSTRPSKLENLILDDNSFNDEIINRATKTIKFITNNQLSKYNHAVECELQDIGLENNTKPTLLLIDQTFNDASVIGAGANISDFQTMVDDAIKLKNSHKIFVKIHPEVIAGKKKGYLYDLINKSSHKEAFQIISNDYNPISLLKHMNEIFTVSSQMGFEALLLNKKTTCYGMAFYSGWGISIDKKTCDRRNKTRDVEQVFAAAYLLYTKYLNPYNNQVCAFEEAANILNTIKQVNDENRESIICLHMKPWKRKAVNGFLSYNNKNPIHLSNEDKAVKLAKSKNARIYAWAAHISEDLEKKCIDNNIKFVKVEDGFIRSKGLGANFNLPYSLSFDDLGIYYSAQTESRMEYILNNTEFSPEQIERSRKLIQVITDSKLSKYNLGNGTDAKAEQDLLNTLKDLNKKIILVPGQVDDDKSILFGADKIKSSFELLKEVRLKNNDAYIIFKPHPDVMAGQRKKYAEIDQFPDYADCIISNTDILKLIDLSDEIHVLTSLTGFEALLRNKLVYCYGMPFYAGWGLTNDNYKCNRRTKKLRLEELVTATLILYPRYIHPFNLQPCSPEQFIASFQEKTTINSGFISYLRIYCGKIKKGLGLNG